MPKIIMVSGKQGSGKTTLADSLAKELSNRGFPVHRLRFAKVLYEIHDTIYKLIEPYGLKLTGAKDGELLQYLGTEWGQTKFGKSVWVECLKSSVSNLKDTDIVIIDDGRFEHEMDAFPDAVSIRLTCPENIRRSRCSYFRENTTHPSEISLDSYESLGKFTKIIDSEVHDNKSVLQISLQTVYKAIYSFTYSVSLRGNKIDPEVIDPFNTVVSFAELQDLGNDKVYTIFLGLTDKSLLSKVLTSHFTVTKMGAVLALSPTSDRS